MYWNNNSWFYLYFFALCLYHLPMLIHMLHLRSTALRSCPLYLITKQYLKNRLGNHKYDCHVNSYLKNDKTALAEHHFQSNHNLDFNNVIILDREKNKTKRCVSEMVCININLLNEQSKVTFYKFRFNFSILTFCK